MKWIKIEEDGDYEVPMYESEKASGMDVRAYLKGGRINLYPGNTAIVSTGLKVELDKGSEIQIRPRSGLAFKYGVTVLNAPGTIDEDYKGELKVILINLGRKTYVINDGERICQAIYSPVFRAEEYVRKEYEGERGAGGMGSTGSM